MRRTIPILAAFLGLCSLVNASFMIFDPVNWYFAVPGVTSTGAFNQHFIRDIGMIYGMLGTCFLVGAWMSILRFLLWTLGTIWLAAHAIFHLWEAGAGICGSGRFLIDFPLVILPAIIGVALSGWAFSQRPPPSA